MSDIVTGFLLDVHQKSIELHLPELTEATAAAISRTTGKPVLKAWVEYEKSKPLPGVTERPVSRVKPRQIVSLYPINNFKR